MQHGELLRSIRIFTESGLDHSDTDGMILRTQLTPVFDANDIDVVLQGHDHTYSRSKLLYGDGQTHQ